MQSNLAKLKNRLLNNSNKQTVASLVYHVAKELSCIPDLIGREYEGYIEDGKKKIKFKFRQKPMKIPSFMALVNELEADYKRQEKEAKKARRRR